MLNKLMMDDGVSDTTNTYTLSVACQEFVHDGMYGGYYGYYADYMLGNINPTVLDDVTIKGVFYYYLYYPEYKIDDYILEVLLSAKIADEIIVTINNVDYTLPYTTDSATSDGYYKLINTESTVAVKNYFTANNGKDVRIKIRKGE